MKEIKVIIHKTVITAIALVISLCAFGCQSRVTRPNVVLIIGDDISFDDFGCYGNPNIRTPNVDKLVVCQEDLCK